MFYDVDTFVLIKLKDFLITSFLTVSPIVLNAPTPACKATAELVSASLDVFFPHRSTISHTHFEILDVFCRH